MVELLHSLEQDRRRNFSLPAFMDHLDSIVNPEGTPATTNLWLTQSSGYESKTSFAKIINSDNYINHMHKIMHLPQEVISTIENGDALHQDPSSDIPYSVSKVISFKDESEAHILEPIPVAVILAIPPSTSKTSVPLKTINSRSDKNSNLKNIRTL